MTEMGIIREDLDTLHDLSMEKVEVPSKTKSALTREFTKLQGKTDSQGKSLGKASGKRKVDEMEDEEEEDDELEDEFDMKELQL